MSYKSTRRQWVKLWVNEWLDGTTRFELTAAQRLLWVDLLALAGRSRFPGFIYAGDGGDGKRVGYPIAYLAGVLQMDEIALNNTMKLLVDKGHITLEESSPECYIIGIVNWEKYQSEYMRQRAYRKVTPKVTSHSPSRLLVEEEVEGEAEGEKKKTSSRIRENRSNVGQLHFSGSRLKITLEEHEALAKAYEGMDIASEYLKMDSWLVTNHRNYRAFGRFANSWLGRAKIPETRGNGQSKARDRESRSADAISNVLGGPTAVAPAFRRGLPSGNH